MSQTHPDRDVWGVQLNAPTWRRAAIRHRVLIPLRIFSLLTFLTFALSGVTPTAAQTIPPPITCTTEAARAAFLGTGTYFPTADSALAPFVTAHSGQLWLGDQPYVAHGVNYYPSRYPWRRFLTETDLPSVEHEFELLAGAGFNTLRLFLWNQALFQCPGTGAIPQPAAFSRLDAIIRLAAQYHFRLIMTLNDLPDLFGESGEPFYTNPPLVQLQTDYIVRRYAREPAILMWDVRNEGDIDYTRQFTTREAVYAWLAQATVQVRSIDANHLITAGWMTDSEQTVPYVDVVSLHHWSPVSQLYGRVDSIRAVTDKPILLEEVGYSTQNYDPLDQAYLLQGVIDAAPEMGLAGWLIWTAFDFPIDRSCYPSPCLSPDNREHYFGLWTLDYTPKPAVQLFLPPG
ncbi:MAG: cellulase family glycosylhydrolase [Anaerolineae bacterium]